MAAPRWKIAGEYMESCNCDYLCPCIFTNPQAPVTYDHCTALMVFRIDRGRHGRTKLDGRAGVRTFMLPVTNQRWSGLVVRDQSGRPCIAVNSIRSRVSSHQRRVHRKDRHPPYRMGCLHSGSPKKTPKRAG